MSDFETIRERLLEREVYGYHERSSFNRSLAIAYASALQDAGSWADINYDDRGRSTWLPAMHLGRTNVMLRGARHRDVADVDRLTLLDAARSAQRFWLGRRPESDNWWHNTIGGPSSLMRLLILFGEDLESELREATLNILADVEIGMTGQNRAWVSTINFVRSVLIEDEELVRVALAEVLGEVAVSDGPEGIQPGWSFHQHGPLLYQGNYGAHFLETVAPYATLLNGTQLELSHEQVGLLTRLTLEGTSWMTWGSRMDFNVVGRFISSPHRSRWESEKLVEPCEHLAEVDAGASESLLAFRDRLEDSVPPGQGAPAGNRYFWRSDFMVHRAQERYLSIRMSSTRTVRSESCNSEGLQNYHMGDGVTLFVTRGDEYDGIFPAWDWKRIPGVTCQRADEPLGPLSVGKDLGSDLFVGGASDGRDGAAGMRIVRDGVSARKAWFCQDETLVCLGSDIASHARYPVTTSINQCLMKRDVYIGTSEGFQEFLYTDWLFGGLPWVHHDGIGYLLLQQMAVDLRKEPQWGAWKVINGNTSAARVMRDVFSLWIDHGIGPLDAHYAYAVVMGVDVKQTADVSGSPPFDIVANTADMQAVRWGSGLTQAVFWKPGEIELLEGRSVAVNQGCVLMVRDAELPVANPNQLSERIEVELRERDAVRELTIEYPQGGEAGKSVTRSL